MKKLLVIVALAVAVAGALFFVLRGKNSEPKFKTEKVTRGEIVSSVSATGTINPVNTISVGTQVSGTIKKLYADYNSQVKANQLIALIDPAPFEAQVGQSKANLIMAKAEVEKAKALLLQAGQNLARTKELFKKNFVPQSDLDTAIALNDTAQADLNVASARVAQMRAANTLAETNLRYTRIVSPVDGTVISRNVNEGQTVAASFQTPTLFSIAKDLADMQIDTNIAEADVGRINEGMPVEFRVDAYTERLFTGKVGQVRNAAVTIQNVVTYDVVVSVDNKEMLLKPGMTANVSVIIDRKPDVLRVPNAALRFTPAGSEKSKEPAVWVLENGEPKKIAVKRGLSDGSLVEVTSPELSEGREILTDSLDKKPAARFQPPPMPGMR